MIRVRSSRVQNLTQTVGHGTTSASGTGTWHCLRLCSRNLTSKEDLRMGSCGECHDRWCCHKEKYSEEISSSVPKQIHTS